MPVSTNDEQAVVVKLRIVGEIADVTSSQTDANGHILGKDPS